MNENDELIDYAIALDSIPGVWGQPRTIEQVQQSALKTYDNYVYMLERVKSPRKLLPVFHQGESWDNLERFLENDNVEYMCLSGSKDADAKKADAWFRKCFNIIKSSKNPNIKIHFLGSGNMERANRFPITSMDATSWIMTGASGNILTDSGVLYVGDGCKTLKHKSPKLVDKLEKMCKDFGVTLEGVGSDYKQRMLFNIRQVLKESKSVSPVKYKIRRGGLLSNGR